MSSHVTPDERGEQYGMSLPASATELIPRRAGRMILRALSDTRIVLVLGARQTGKSTLTAEITRSEFRATSITLDDEDQRRRAAVDAQGFLATYSLPLLIDEVQRVPELLIAIKAAVDRDKRPGRFLLTGSANILTAPRVYEALTGRVEIIELWPLAQSEIERATGNPVDAFFRNDPPRIQDAPIGRAAFVDRAARGGYPDAWEREAESRGRWFRSYATSTIQRDLRDIADIQRIEQMPRLLRLLAAQAANLYSARGLAAPLSLSDKTVQDYTRLLETIYLVRRAPAWRTGLHARERHAPKMYLVDTGLLASLLSANEDRIATDDQITGKIFENFVAMELVKHAGWCDSEIGLYHWRDNQDEVDIILENAAGDIVGIEAKATATVRSDHFKGLRKLRERVGDRFVGGYVVCAAARTFAWDDRLWSVPVSGLWSG